MSMKEFIVQALQASKWSLQLSFTSIGRPSGLGRQVVSFISGGIPALRARHAEGQGQTVAEASRMCSRLLEPEDDACRCSRSPGYYGTKCKEPRQMLWLSQSSSFNGTLMRTMMIGERCYLLLLQQAQGHARQENRKIKEPSYYVPFK